MIMLPRALSRLALDWLVPLAIFVIGVVNVARLPNSTEYPGNPLAHLAFLATAVVCLGLRRRASLVAPLLALLVVGLWSSVMWPADAQGPFEGFVVLVAGAYCFGAGNRGRRLMLAGLLLAGFFVIGEVVALANGGRDGDLVAIAVWQIVAFAVGFVINHRAEQTREARAHAAQLDADQHRRTSDAVEAERARIARELHDVVAHSLSVIVVQVAAEQRAIRQGKGSLESASAVFGSVERNGRDALDDLRRLLGLLRRVDEPASLAPAPTLAELDGLVRDVRAAGIDVRVTVHGDRVPLPPGLDLTAYRIVQEALTNVLKHAGARRVDIVLTYRNAQLEVAVSDDGHGTPHPAPPDSGHGLLGMRERVTVFGGSVSAGVRPEGGWRVHARLPVSAEA